eukprot:2877412-Amphidinium_carterae.1
MANKRTWEVVLNRCAKLRQFGWPLRPLAGPTRQLAGIAAQCIGKSKPHFSWYKVISGGMAAFAHRPELHIANKQVLVGWKRSMSVLLFMKTPCST